MIKLYVYAIIFFVVQQNFGQASNYKNGDTLHVFTINGLKLRESGQANSRILNKMALGEKVIIIEEHKGKLESIEGFEGRWVEVKYGDKTGYAFDGFLSYLPIPSQELSLNDPTDYNYDGYPMYKTLGKYIQTSFIPICEKIYYQNGSDGEGFHSMSIQKLNKSFIGIEHGYWENQSIELCMPIVRLAEVKNLILQLANLCSLDKKTFNKIKLYLQSITEDSYDPYYIKSEFNDIYILLRKFNSNEQSSTGWAVEFDIAGS